jgi:hypothetical protein
MEGRMIHFSCFEWCFAINPATVTQASSQF